MGFRTVLLRTLGLLAMFSTLAVGQFQMNPPSFGPLPSPLNFPSPENFPSNNQHGNVNPFNPLSNPLFDLAKNFPPMDPSPASQPGMTGPNFPDILPPPNSNPGGFNINNFQPNPNQNPFNSQQGNFGPSSNIPQGLPPMAPPGGFQPFNSQQNIPPSFPSSNIPGDTGSYGTQPSAPQMYSPNNPPADFNSNGPIFNGPQISPPSSQPNFNTYNPQLQQNPSPGGQLGPPINSNIPQNQQQNPFPGGQLGPPINSNIPQNQQQNPSPAGQLGPPINSNIPQNQSPSSNNPSSNQNSVPSNSGGGGTIPNGNNAPDSSGGGNGKPKHHVSKLRPSSHAHPAAGHRSRSSAFHPVKDDNPLKDYRIVCLFNNKHYYRGGFTPSEIDPTLCTHVNYEFAILDPKSYEMMVGEPDLDIAQNFYQEVIDLRKGNPKLKVLVSLGGWVDSTKKYSELAADEEKRKNFVEKAVAFLRSHEFDGMDLAWEYPNCWQGAININPKDKENFVLLLKDLKSAFQNEGLILSVSVGAIKREVEAAYDVPAISKTVDYINVMTYDMHGPWEKVTGHHVQFDKMPTDSDPYCNTKAAMKLWADKGAEPKKLNMGIAMYAKTFTLEDENNHGMGAPAIGPGDPGPDSDEGGFLLYNEVCPMLNEGNWTEAEDKQAGFYAYNGDQWACYDNPLMMVRKAKFVVEEGYGGVLLKDLSGDDYKGTCFSMPFPLLKMCRLEMIQRIRRKMRHLG